MKTLFFFSIPACFVFFFPFYTNKTLEPLAVAMTSLQEEEDPNDIGRKEFVEKTIDHLGVLYNDLNTSSRSDLIFRDQMINNIIDFNPTNDLPIGEVLRADLLSAVPSESTLSLGVVKSAFLLKVEVLKEEAFLEEHYKKYKKIYKENQNRTDDLIKAIPVSVNTLFRGSFEPISVVDLSNAILVWRSELSFGLQANHKSSLPVEKSVFIASLKEVTQENIAFEGYIRLFDGLPELISLTDLATAVDKNAQTFFTKERLEHISKTCDCSYVKNWPVELILRAVIRPIENDPVQLFAESIKLWIKTGKQALATQGIEAKTYEKSKVELSMKSLKNKYSTKAPLIAYIAQEWARQLPEKDMISYAELYTVLVVVLDNTAELNLEKSTFYQAQFALFVNDGILPPALDLIIMGAIL